MLVFGGGLLLAVLLPLFAHLGLWQWDKGQAMLARQAALAAFAAGPPRPMPPLPLPAEELRDRRFAMTGIYEASRQILIDNRVHNGVAGYEVVTPLKLAGSSLRVLVNRGWVPLGADRSRLPELPPPAGLQTVSGVAVLPDATGLRLGPPERGWQPLWQRLDWPRFQRNVPYPLQTVVIRLDAEAPGGYARDWPRPDERAGIHLGYALQWFGFAAAALGIWLWLLVRRR